MRLVKFRLYLESLIATLYSTRATTEEGHFQTQFQDLQRQLQNELNYANLLLQIGKGSYHHNDVLLQELSYNDDTRTSRLRLPNIPYFVNKEEGEGLTFNEGAARQNLDTEDSILAWLYPNGFDPSQMSHVAIIASLNQEVDAWNTKIQKLNPNEIVSLKSRDCLADVDDPRDVLKSLLSVDLLNCYRDNQSPPHNLQLAVGDICYLYRTLSKKDGLVTNARVRILEIKRHSIRIQTLTKTPKSFSIPRVRFTVKLPWGKSYKLIRSQFPLRLAYAISINKSQGQEYDKVVFDIRNQPFQHGHSYVALSRVTSGQGVALYVKEDSDHEQVSVMNNVVYNELFEQIR
jgi:hypothetical protein